MERAAQWHVISEALGLICALGVFVPLAGLCAYVEISTWRYKRRRKVKR